MVRLWFKYLFWGYQDPKYSINTSSVIPLFTFIRDSKNRLQNLFKIKKRSNKVDFKITYPKISISKNDELSKYLGKYIKRHAISETISFLH